MSATSTKNPALSFDSWGFAAEADRRFRRISNTTLLLFVALMIAMRLIDLSGLEKGGGDLKPDRVVTLLPDAVIAEKVEEPKPEEAVKKEEPKPEEPKPQPKPEPKAKPKAEPKPEPKIEPKIEPRVEVPPQPTREELVANARQKAAQTGVMAMADSLKALRDNSLSGMDASRPLSSSVVSAQAGTGGSGAPASTISQSVASSSGGISGAGTGETRRSATGAGIGQRRTTVVESPIGVGPKKDPGSNGDKLIGGRTLEEIQLTFDRNKSSFYSIFQRALREKPDLRGKLVVSLTIAPDGSVTACEIVSSELGDPELESRLVQRVKLLNFGAKPGPSFTYPNYPIYLYPA